MRNKKESDRSKRAPEKAPQRLPTATAQQQYLSLLWAGEQLADGTPSATSKKDRLAGLWRRFALWCEEQTPPGRQAAGQLRVFGWGLLAAAVYSLSFLWRLLEELEVFDLRGAWRRGVRLPSFGQLFSGALLGFWVLAAVMAAFAALYYAGLWQGAKSIYLLRRLPQKGAVARRCLTLPALGVLASGLAAAACGGVHYIIYLLTVWVSS